MQKRTTKNSHDPFAVAVIDATGSIMGHVLLLFLQFQPFFLKKTEYGPLVLVVDPCFSAVETFEFAASIEEEGTVTGIRPVATGQASQAMA